jgi:hypothetical protein
MKAAPVLLNEEPYLLVKGTKSPNNRLRGKSSEKCVSAMGSEKSNLSVVFSNEQSTMQ